MSPVVERAGGRIALRQILLFGAGPQPTASFIVAKIGGHFKRDIARFGNLPLAHGNDLPVFATATAPDECASGDSLAENG